MIITITIVTLIILIAMITPVIITMTIVILIIIIIAMITRIVIITITIYMRSDYHAKHVDAKWGLQPNREEWVGARPRNSLRQIGRTFRRRMALRLPDHLPVSMPA